MKLTVLFTGFLLVASVVVYLVLATPYSLYDMAIIQGMDNSYLRIKRSTPALRSGGDYQLESLDGVIVSDQNVWKTLHFKTFKIPLPVHHPLFITLPHISMANDQESIGFKLLNQKEREIITLLLKDEFSLDKRFDDDIFNLPFFKNRFSRLDPSKIWKDVFTLKINESRKNSNFTIGNLLNDLDKITFEMLYSIYILKLRISFFGDAPLKKIKYWNDRNMGVVELVDDETLAGKPQRFEQEMFFYLVRNKVYTFTLRYRLGDIAAAGYKYKVFNEVEYLKSDTENAIMLYSEYNTFPYHKKVDQEGMIYLYSAWTHDMERASFFAEMINFMERGTSSYMQVRSLYEFALKKFGSNFSSDLEKLKETQFQKLQRKISEEKEKELRELKKKDGYIPDTFDSKEHKINFFLNRAKESGQNIDSRNNELVGD